MSTTHIALLGLIMLTVLMGGMLLMLLRRIGTFERENEARTQALLSSLTQTIYDQSEKTRDQHRSIQEFIHEKMEAIHTKNTAQQEKNSELFVKIITEQTAFKETLIKSLNDNLTVLGEKQEQRLRTQSESSRKDFDALVKTMDEKLEAISGRVDKRLKDGFENVDKTFKEIITSVTKISEAQKKIETLSTEVVSLQNVLSDKKSRGVFGEVQLGAILTSIFGDREELYATQYTLEGTDGQQVIADAVIKVPEPVGFIAVDSKFPLENYTRMTHAEHEAERKDATRNFKKNLKKHTDDIADKYIIPGTTAQMAILFLPAEAIFAELNAYHQDIIDYAQTRSVWIASPTTMMALFTTVLAIVRDIKTKEQAQKIQEELIKLSTNFSRYKERWEKLAKHIDTVNKDVKDITVTTDKISSAFHRIEKVEFDDEDSSFLS